MKSHQAIEESGITFRKAALITSISLLIMFVAAMFAELYARQSLIVVGNAFETAKNIIVQSISFRIGLLCFLIVMICDMLVTWGLYIFLKPINKSISLLAAWFRMIYTAIFGISILNLVNGFRLINHGANIKTDPTYLYEQAMLNFQSFDDGWAISFMFFGFHLMIVGYLILKSDYMPKFLGGLLIIAAIAYLGDNLSKLLMPNYAEYKTVITIFVAIPSIIGELGLAIWLLVKGGKTVEK